MKPIEWLGKSLRLLDQTQLPLREVYLETSNYREVVQAIKQLKVRGAPAIGIAAAYGIALGGISIPEISAESFRRELQTVMDEFAHSRPTAVNLFYAIERQKKAIALENTADAMKQALVAQALRINNEEEKAMADLSRNGAVVLKDGFTIITHCNTGQLATGVSYGTALGVIKAAAEQGKRLMVYADETRPLLQGARLTAWELQHLNIPFRLITDNMAGYFMHRGHVDCVIVGADRIAANGDTANKIGTYSLAVLAKENRIPFYIAAPLSTIDRSISSGEQIPIEERSPEEVLEFRGVRSAPDNATALNPAFDVTPARYIRAVITQNGIIEKPFTRWIKSMFQEDS